MSRAESTFALSRRWFLGGAGVALAMSFLEAAEAPQSYGITALLDGSGMVRIPAGEFRMGAAQGNPDEGPAHRVRISHPFEMSKYEVTQSQWETVMTDPHLKPGESLRNSQGEPVSNNPSHFHGMSLPVDSVSWYDIQLFLTRLNERDPKHVYRLPTEAEWEYAQRAGKTSESGALNARAWHKGNSGESTHTVGEREPNAFGLYDMDGNVSEWVHDWYAGDYYANSPAKDPAGPQAGSYRVYRGGCWFDAEKDFRATLRRFDFPVSRFYNVGFRVVRAAR